MLLHIIPRLYVTEPDTPQCELIDSHCPDLGVKLRNGIKMGYKAVQGILIETTQRVCQFTMPMRWAVGTGHIVSHRMQYFVIDDKLDAITDSMVLWLGMPPSLGGFGARWPLSTKGQTPAAAQPRMELVGHKRAGHYADRTDSVGRVLERCEMFQVPTVGHEHVLHNSKSDIYAHIPTTDMAFTASV